MTDFTYDTECYPNVFILRARTDNKFFSFQVSEFVDDSVELFLFLKGLETFNHRMVGFNNYSYDYIFVHYILNSSGSYSYHDLWRLNEAYFDPKNNGRFNKISIPEKQHKIHQVDLYKIHHFDNAAKRTSLKMIEFNMCSDSIVDLPYEPGKVLNRAEIETMIEYCGHDVDETHTFKEHSKPMIEFRDTLSKKRWIKFTNFNDTKIGATFFELELAKHGVKKYTTSGHLNQTFRDEIRVGEVILPYIKFERDEFKKILDFFKSSVMNEIGSDGLLELKGFFNGVTTTVDGFTFDFGAGGIHGSVRKKIVRSSKTHCLLDWDVSSYYPNLSIVNRFFPAHLTEIFCDVYHDIYLERKKYDKKDPNNGMLKLALNSVFGNSSSIYSMMLDQKFTMSITINGQLLLCMLAEQLMKIPGLEMIQVNTDGLTILCPREYRNHACKIWDWWQSLTGLELEESEYKAMFIRDVNNYIAEKINGDVKRIGCYAHETPIENPATRELAWHKNHSARVIAKAAELVLVKGMTVEKAVMSNRNPFDFCLRTKVPRSSKLILRDNDGDRQIQNITRYYVSKTGGSLIKIMPHTSGQIEKWEHGDHYQHEITGEYQVVGKGKKPKSGRFKPVPEGYRKELPPREIGIESAWLCSECNNISDFNFDNLNYEYYFEEVRKITDSLLLG